MHRVASLFSFKKYRQPKPRKMSRRSLSFTFGFRETRVLTEMGEGAVSRKSALAPLRPESGQTPFYSKSGILPIYDSTESLDSNKRASATIKIKHLHRLCDLSRFPKLDDCAHFHYDQVELLEIKVALTTENQENIHLHSSETENDPTFHVNVSSGGKLWMVRRTYENFRLLDKQLHKCIFDRKFSQLPEIPKGDVWVSEGMECLQTKLADYLMRFTAIAGNMINCGPILNWLEMDNRGNRLMVTQESAINTPAIAAAHVVKRYNARAQDEISFEVGDIISVIDMPPPEDTMWWRGKRGFEVGFFPCECVEIIGDQVPQAMVSRIPQTPGKPGSKRAKLDEERILRKRGKLISFLRMFFSTRPNRNLLKQSGIFKERVFGCDLGEHLLNTSQNVPLVLKCCSEAIEEFGVVDGIYRLSGVSSNIQRLRLAFDENREPDLTAEEYQQDIHCISSLLKMYFRELPNPLLTYQLYDKFASAIQDHDDRLMKIHDIVQQLPPPHYRTSQYLFRHLATVAASGADTGMHPKNLAIVWAPNLLRSKELESGGGAAALQGVGLQAVVTEFLIRYADLIFSDKMPAFSVGDKPVGQKRARPKSLAISTPTKLLSLEEARERALGTGNSPPNSQKFIEVGGGPSNLPEKYHTVIEVPGRDPSPEGSRKRSSSVKGKKSQGSWKNFFTRKQNPKSKRKGSAPNPGSFYAQTTEKALTEDDIAVRRKLRTTKSVDSIISIGSMSGRERMSPRDSAISYTENGVINVNMLQMERKVPLTMSAPGRKVHKRARSLPECSFEKKITMIIDDTDDENDVMHNGDVFVDDDTVFVDVHAQGDDKLTSDLGDIMIAQAAAEIAGKTQLMTANEEKMIDTLDHGGSPEMPGLSASAPVTLGPLSMEMSIDDLSLTWSDFSGQQDMLSPDGDGFESFLRSVTGGDATHDKHAETHVTSPSKRSGSMTSLDHLRLPPGGSYQKLQRSPSDDIFPMEITETMDDNDQPNNDLVLTAKSQAQHNVRVRSYSSSAHWAQKDDDITDDSEKCPPEKTVSPLSRHLSLPSDIERSLETMVDQDFGSDVLSSCTPSDAERTLAKSLDDQHLIQVTAIVHDEGVAIDTPSPTDEPRYDSHIPGADSGLSHGSEIHQNTNGTTVERESQGVEQRTTLESAFGSHVTDSGYASSLPMSTHLVPFTPDTDTEVDLETEKSKNNMNIGEGMLDSIGDQITSDLNEMESRPVRKSRSYEKAISSGEGLDYEFSDTESKRASMLEDVEEVSENSSSTVTDVCVESERLNSGKIFVKEKGSRSSVSDQEIIIDYPPLQGEAKDGNQDDSTIVGDQARSEYVECKTGNFHMVERRQSAGKDAAEGTVDHKDNFERSFEETLDSLSPHDNRFSLEMADLLPPGQEGIQMNADVGESDVDNLPPSQKVAKKPLEKQKSTESEPIRGVLERKGSKMSCATPSSISPDPMSIHLVDEICEIYEQTKRQSGLFETRTEEVAPPYDSPEHDFRTLPSKPGVKSPVHEVRVLVAGKLSSEYSPPEEGPATDVEAISEETSTVEEDSTTPELAILIPDEDTTASLESPMDDLEPFAVEVRPEDLGQLKEGSLNLEVSVETKTIPECEVDVVDAQYAEQLEESLDVLEETSDRWRRSGSQEVHAEHVATHRLSAELDQMLVEKRDDEVALEKIIQTIEHAETVLDEAASQMVSEDEVSVTTEQTEVPGSPSPGTSEVETPTAEPAVAPMKGTITALIEPEDISLTASFDSFELDAPMMPSETTSMATIPSPDIVAPKAEPEDSLTPSSESPEDGTPTKQVYEVTPGPLVIEHEEVTTETQPKSQDVAESVKPSDTQPMLNQADIMSTSLPPMHLEYDHHDNKTTSAHETQKPEPEFVKDVEVRSESLPRKSSRLPQTQEESKLPVPVKTPPSIPKRSKSPTSIVNQIDWISRDRAKSKEKEVPTKVEGLSKFGFREKTGSESGERRHSRSQLSWERCADPESKPSWQKSPEPEKVTRPSWKKSPEPEKVVRPSWQKAPSPEPEQEPKVQQQRSPEQESPTDKTDPVHPEWKPREAIRLSTSRFKNVKPLLSCLDPEEHESLAPLITSPPPGGVAPFQDTADKDDSTDDVFLPKQEKQPTEKQQPTEKTYKISASDILSKYSDDSVSPSAGRRDSGSRRPLSRGSFDGERQTPSPSKRVDEPYSTRKLIQPGWTSKREEKVKPQESALSVDTSSVETSHEPVVSPKDGFKPRERMQLSSARFSSLSSSLTGVTLDKLREPKMLSKEEKEEQAQARLSSGSMSASYPADPSAGVARIRRSKSSASDETIEKADAPASDWKGKKSQSFGQESEPVAMETSRLPRLGSKDGSKSRSDHAHNALHAKQLKTAEKLFIDESELESDIPGEKSQDAQTENTEKKTVGVKRKKSVRELLSKFESGGEDEGEQSEVAMATEEVVEDKHRSVPAVFQKPKIIRLRSLSPSKDSPLLSSKKSPEIGDKKDGEHEVMDTSPKFQRSISQGDSYSSVQGRQRSPRLSPRSDSDDAKHSTEKVSPKLRPKPSPCEIEAAKSRHRGSEGEGVDITDSDKSPNSIRNRLKLFDTSSTETSKISPDFSRFRRTSKDGEEKDADLSKSKIAKPSATFASRSQSQQFEKDQKEELAKQSHFRHKSDMSDKDSIYASHDKNRSESDSDSAEFKSRLQQPQVRTESRLSKTSSRESVSSSGSRGSNRSLGENEADSAQNVKEKFQIESRRLKPATAPGEQAKRESSNSWSSRRISGDGLQRKGNGQSDNNTVTMVTPVAVVTECLQQKKSPDDKPAAAMFGVKLRKTKRLDPETAS
ncbi:uncharacterized protein LOC135502535 isoform X4 [Lineus longissimus]|uniref:uncharacterized protein LOC135502535 isoform X4 n=1 Tax=Lineus longissimus TaxID=88925 RepID=UPI00315CAADF